jgi:Fe-S oxidoreductase
VRSQAHALLCSVEQCNGSGDCRKSNLSGGTICPAYRVSGDELRTTRARANVIREVLTRGVEGKLFEAPELAEVLDSCLSCKGCLGECPSGVDMTRLKAELLQQKYARHGMPLRSWAVARMADVERLGSLVAPLYNYFASARWSSALLKRILQFAPARSIPALSRRTMRALVKSDKMADQVGHDLRAAESKSPVIPGLTGNLPPRKVCLFADEFTNYQEAELGLTFARLLRALGYEVEIPRHRESGRAAISKGDLKRARRIAKANVELLADVVTEEVPLVGIEPSCILSFRDEYPDLVPPEMRDKALDLGRNCLLFDEFLSREIAAGRISPEAFQSAQESIWLHGHCHQKALVGIDKCASVLRTLLPESELHVIPSGCCGMAGSFGYEKEHYETSLAIGEMVLFPAVRQAVAVDELARWTTVAGAATELQDAGKNPAGEGAPQSGRGPGLSTVILAPGTSCRQQILDGTGVRALHPVELLWRQLKA